MTRQSAPAQICSNCRRPIHRQRNGAWYHDRNASVSCWPGDGSDKRAQPVAVQGSADR